MATIRKAAGLIAALILLTGGAFLMGVSTAFGAPVMALGAAAAAINIALLLRRRDDPYDLTKLYETDPMPEDGQEGPRDKAGYCPVCGGYIESPYKPCPRCGSAL